MKFGVTGSTGALGQLIIESLSSSGEKAADIAALARNPEKAENLKGKAEVRIGDYGDPASLEKAFKGVDRLMLVSGSEVGQRAPQHKNIIDAAVKAGVKQLVYTSLFHADSSVSPLAGEHQATEKMIRESGIPFVILRNNWYTENHSDDVLRAKQSGFIESAVGEGKIRSASRKDYAEAAAKVLTGEGHEGRVYELAGEAWSFKDLARTASEVWGRKVKYQSVDAKKRKKHLVKYAGLPEEIADFVTALDVSIKEGALEGNGSDLEKLLGRKPESMEDFFRRLASAD